jgi:hypothetical protein
VIAFITFTPRGYGSARPVSVYRWRRRKKATHAPHGYRCERERARIAFIYVKKKPMFQAFFW